MRLLNFEDCLAELRRSNNAEPGVPEHILPGLARYLVHGIEPGSFLTAMLTNDLRGVMQNADNENIRRLPEIWIFLYNHIPSSAWGSTDKMFKWSEERRQLEAATS